MDAPVLDAFVASCRDACAAIPPRVTRNGLPASGPAEAQLEVALFKTLPMHGVSLHRLGARRVVVQDDWNPAPNGIDFYVWERPNVDLALVAELKFDNVEQRMWDLFKLLAARKLEGNPVAVLVHGDSWSSRKPCAELFPSTPGSTMVTDTLALVDANRAQWARDLRYRGRVLETPRRVRLRSELAGVHLKAFPSYELRIVTIEPEDDEVVHFANGWPARG